MAANPRYKYERNSITIYNLTKEDAMVVQCNVTNKHGYAFANAYFNILTEPPIILEPPLEVKINFLNMLIPSFQFFSITNLLTSSWNY